MDGQRRRYQEVAEVLRKELGNGTFKVGDRLRPERQIAEEMNVSRSLLREAMIMLEIEGLIDVRKGSGTYVVRLPDAEQVTPTSNLEDIGPFELLQARQLMESNIAAFAASMVTKADILRMRDALEREREDLAKGSGGYEADEEFHLLIAEATQNSVLVDMVRNLWQQRTRSRMWDKLHERIFDNTYREEWLNDHQDILDALKRRDPQAAKQAMWQHLENVKKRLMDLSDVDDPAFDAYLFQQDPLTPA
ncbi:HTH-type transcriptional regulator LutR [Pseudovibrio sp. W64]|uniref:FCD domain-containing protein n=1 Tax=unclassified Pseudovibrio TaxID=2627060 RepID=UPI00070E142B|nr:MULTISPECIES: FCD domain-containing protein [unclassified Pseudovibrio]KZK76125.1 HTH-type transcriptional regulator LutR [Pseudovibrio sp. Ad46]KZK79941.1 HTH-type transcriptional regulator LutR [Pseudovibrio sp. Ad13]KZK83969.1 HTH-type transcriptional regulator LutR [Pseudovibrio sp. W64]KZK93028.1 HTH-type transcriptional regulator LutR [Pseudovibrio sp. W74]KZK98055.1 HTH-type transcriptional regulator LutR [Pseudovibrio sp. Ad5]